MIDNLYLILVLYGFIALVFSDTLRIPRMGTVEKVMHGLLWPAYLVATILVSIAVCVSCILGFIAGFFHQ